MPSVSRQEPVYIDSDHAAGTAYVLAETLKDRQAQLVELYDRIGRMEPKRKRVELEGTFRRRWLAWHEIRLDLENCIGKIRDTLCVYGFGDVGDVTSRSLGGTR